MFCGVIVVGSIYCGYCRYTCWNSGDITFVKATFVIREARITWTYTWQLECGNAVFCLSPSLHQCNIKCCLCDLLWRQCIYSIYVYIRSMCVCVYIYILYYTIIYIHTYGICMKTLTQQWPHFDWFLNYRNQLQFLPKYSWSILFVILCFCDITLMLKNSCHDVNWL